MTMLLELCVTNTIKILAGSPLCYVRSDTNLQIYLLYLDCSQSIPNDRVELYVVPAVGTVISSAAVNGRRSWQKYTTPNSNDNMLKEGKDLRSKNFVGTMKLSSAKSVSIENRIFESKSTAAKLYTFVAHICIADSSPFLWRTSHYPNFTRVC
jgi:hypothetical protein